MPPTTKPKILITGASGLLGHPLCELARKKWRVYAQFKRNRPQVEGINAVSLNLTDTERLFNHLEDVAPNILIHAAANANVPYCQKHPLETAEINVSVSVHLARWCARFNVPFVFVSTDQVFDGTAAPYNESASPRPIGIYGEQKTQAEVQIVACNPNALICRLPLMFGLAPYAGNNFMVQLLNAIKNGVPINLFVDEYRTPIDNYSAARGILDLAGRTHGILHLGGRTRLSRYDLGLKMAAAMNVAPKMINAVEIAQTDLSFKRAPDCSLSSRKAFALGFDPTPVDHTVDQVVKTFLREQD